ncbi:hypothetical protein EVAR_39080_1 [Eumeta japonica]|uniref:Uncharacterized protein n=1 Tax=Eumeta variegata TaxID=151549 RepID=A0A4C1WR31_EUMVA|nr:hypothetical protein EVAR_39080_1 [Eumeta japonica]
MDTRIDADNESKVEEKPDNRPAERKQRTSPESTDKQKTITHILKEDAQVISKEPQEDLEIRDQNDVATKTVRESELDLVLTVEPYRYLSSQREMENGPLKSSFGLAKIVSVLFPQQREFNYPSVQCELEDILPITGDELIEVCNRVGNKKALRLDGMSNIALKTTIKAASALFLEIYKTCPIEDTFPRKWKQQRLVLLLKAINIHAVAAELKGRHHKPSLSTVTILRTVGNTVKTPLFLTNDERKEEPGNMFLYPRD